MKKTIIIGHLLILIFNSYSQTSEFSPKELAVINTKAINLLQKYELLINQIGHSIPIDVNEAKSSSESFIELFVNRKVLVYNDLDPSHQLSEFYEAETFASNLILWYPDGLSVLLNYTNAKTTPIRQHDANIFSIDIAIEKKIDGNYLNKQNNKNMENLVFRIAFSVEGKLPVEFKIAGIRNAASQTKVDDLKTMQEVNSEDLSDEELAKAYSGVKTKLKDYANFLALLGDPQESAEDKEFYKESFTKLFQSSQVKIFNDIDSKPKTTLISVPEYLELYATNFPEGIKNISLNIDSAEFGKVSKNDQGGYFTYIYIDKYFSAVSKQKELYKTNDNLMFKINFVKSGNSYASFNIESIDKTGFSYFEASGAGDNNVTLAITPVTRKGISVYGTASYGISALTDENLTSLSLEKDLHEWSIKNNYGMAIGGGINYFFTDALGISSGLELNTFSTKYSLNGTFQDDEYASDVNGNPYYLIVTAEYDSTLSINTLNFPVLFKYIFGKPNSWGFSIDAGLKMTYILSAKYNTTGNYIVSGFWPNSPPSIQTKPGSFIGYEDRTDIELNGDLDYKKISLSGYANMNLLIPLGYYSSLEIGPEVLYGFTNIENNSSDYIDIFGKSTTRKPVTISYFGVNIKYLFKL